MSIAPKGTRFNAFSKPDYPIKFKQHGEMTFPADGPLPNLLESWGMCTCGWQGNRWIGVGASVDAARNESREHVRGQHQESHHGWVKSVWSYVE